jgi:S1-C subfamily serine protease
MFHDGVEVPIKKITPSKTRDAARLEGTSQKRRTAAQYTAKVPYAFEDVYAAGYPLGLGLVVTTGVINYPPANSREGSLMCSACAVYGNSGGGVFDITGKLIGITISVACYSSGIEANIVPHMHMFLPLYEISELIGE